MAGTEHTFLKGRGEMAELTRRYNWGNTPVGDPAGWPLPLRTTVSNLLNSRFPMFLLWGEEYIQFYNDAYRPSLGTDGKHPTALGQRGRECWKEAWDLLGPMLDQVRLGGEAIWKEDQPVPINRNGRLEMTYWTFSYSPVFDEAGNVGGVLSTCFETTEKVTSTVKMLENANELNFAIEAAELGTWDLNPATGRFAANARVKEWFGLNPEDEIPLELSIRAIAPEDQERIAAAIARAMEYESGGRYEETFAVINPHTGRQRIVLGKGRAWFGADNIAYRFNGTLQDITDRTLADKAQKEAEAKFRNVSDTSPTGLWLSDKEGNLIYLNRTLADWTGMPYNSLLGNGWADAVIDEDRPGAAAAFMAAITNRTHYDVEFRINRYDGTVVWCRAAGDPYYNDKGDYEGYAGYCMIIQDVKDLNARIEENRRLLLNSFEQAPVAIAIMDKHNLTFTMVNTFYAELVGRKREDIVNKPLLEALPELTGQGFDKLLENVLDTGIAYKANEVSVDLVRGGKLETIYVDLVYQPQYNDHNEIHGILVVATDVTSQVLSRKQIEESEARFRSLMEEAPVATSLFTGRDMKIEMANDVMLGYWGKGKGVIGKPLAEALPELKGQPFLELLDNIFTNGITHSERAAEAKLVVDGELRTFYFDYTYKPLRNIHGAIYGIMDMAIDVTEQVIATRKLEESERFSRYIFYNSPVAKLVYVGEDMVLKEANEAMLHMLGRDASILNKPIMETVPELARTDIGEKYSRVLTTGEAHYEYAQKILLVKNGEQYWGYYDYIYKPLFDMNGGIYGVVCTAVDVTKDTIARQRIEAAETSLRGAIELAELATWSIDFTSNTVHYSERMQQWIGVNSSVLQIDNSPRVHPKDRERVAAAIHKAVEPGGNGYFNEVYTILNMTTGQQRIIHANGMATFDEKGKALTLSGTARDVTLEQEMQTALQNQVQQRTEELEMLNESLRRSNDELSQYAHIASHDLQEPLRKIRVYSDMLAGLKELPADSKRFVAKIEESAGRMTRLIKDLLEFSSLAESSKTKTPVDLNTVVADVTKDFDLLVTEKQATINAGKLPALQATRLQMNQLFYNIIGNALKFSKSDVPPVIDIMCRVATNEEKEKYLHKASPLTTYYNISVTDNGIGFDAQYSEQIFEVFKRLHARDKYQGSGIGLALCRRIAINHGGNLYCESEPGRGTTFYILLPETTVAHNS